MYFVYELTNRDINGKKGRTDILLNLRNEKENDKKYGIGVTFSRLKMEFNEIEIEELHIE
ncbi:hypothetical protein PIROE2DRAFT_13095 [Piromyces sp. E2]|nr:hypothetical protein PIROE2DRAFT_13095 [Piromyces sp. E2]|eukprot:OUM61021.1 hypothetical protein PIROE2DRAFT_13095 [Piromyces sp. E2]